MPGPWTCFMVEPAEMAKVNLRRYYDRKSTEEKVCPGLYGYHNAKTFICETRQFIREDDGVWDRDQVEEPDMFDPRWPIACEYCDYQFKDSDRWQVFYDYQYIRPETGEIWSTHEVPPGAMFDYPWYKVFGANPGSDGRILAVALPPSGGHDVWCIDGPSSSGGYWTREGVAPNLTVSPSILTGRYHGFLQNGVLTESLGDRPL